MGCPITPGLITLPGRRPPTAGTVVVYVVIVYVVATGKVPTPGCPIYPG